MARSGATRRTSPAPIAMPGCTRRATARKPQLSYLGHALVENRNGLIAAAMVTHADGYAERDAALLMLAASWVTAIRAAMVGADKAYDSQDFVRTARELNVTPHVTRNDKTRSSNLDLQNHAPAGLRRQPEPPRWLIEKGFVMWLKQTGPLRQVKLRGLEKGGLVVCLQLRRT